MSNETTALVKTDQSSWWESVLFRLRRYGTQSLTREDVERMRSVPERGKSHFVSLFVAKQVQERKNRAKSKRRSRGSK